VIKPNMVIAAAMSINAILYRDFIKEASI